ncbi:INO80 complex subunit C isoform A [Alligator mississippiensis]|uniref:INO80 complex subunit C isoform A n=1 Tax=Alligator mississippiensis TaxID=8496 RepID=A0A151M4N9_ALLMI|nr:INO80 complex subunit C isoform A [Alligator mississippiensis]
MDSTEQTKLVKLRGAGGGIGGAGTCEVFPPPPPHRGRGWRRARPGRHQSIGGEAMNENKFLSTDPGTGPMEAAKPLPFKDPNFMHSGIGGAAAGKKNRTWKNLKQILASERALPWQLNDPSYFNIDAPPSFKPAKKYSDISGLPANYTDPQSKLRFSTIEEFAYIRMLPSDVVTGYLALRKATRTQCG